MKKISVLQIADENWQEQYEIPSNIKWTFIALSLMTMKR